MKILLLKSLGPPLIAPCSYIYTYGKQQKQHRAVSHNLQKQITAASRQPPCASHQWITEVQSQRHIEFNQ